MVELLSFKSPFYIPQWRMLAASPNIPVLIPAYIDIDGFSIVPAVTADGISISSDLRNTEVRDPNIFQLFSNTILNRYNIKYDDWQQLSSPNLTTTFGPGATCIFVPHRGPRGTLAAGATTTTITLATALPANVGVNQLANRGDSIGYKIRIIGNAGGSSGKTEERFIIYNTGGTTTPTITLDSPLSFTPILGDAFEFLSGRLYMLGAGTTDVNSFKYYDVITNYIGTCTTVNLPGTISVDSSFVILDEQYVPVTNVPGEGFLIGAGDGGVSERALTATGIGVNTITGQAIGGDAGVLLNEYRNFQIRIVKDTNTPTAVGQRRKIIGHLAGPSPIYTVANWVPQPSADAQFVIENTNELLLWTSGLLDTYTYVTDEMVGVAPADSWTNTIHAARLFAMGAGCCSFQNFAVTLDTAKSYRHSYIFSFRGGNTAYLDLFDIAAVGGPPGGSWTAAFDYASSGTLFTAGTCLGYDSINGIAYINESGTQRFHTFCPKTNNLVAYTFLKNEQIAATGSRMAGCVFVDESTRACFMYYLQSSGTGLFHIITER